MSAKKSKQKRSPSLVLQSRAIKPLIRLLLFVRAGGRCEFDGCNRDVLRHHVTLTAQVFGEMAHIVAFKPRGPRGKSGKALVDINDVQNLMVLCPQCHKLIDDNPGKYTTKILREYKKQHEKRIRYVTKLGPDRQTTVLILKSKIGGNVVQIPMTQILEATAPSYPDSMEPTEIDLSGFNDTIPTFTATAQQEIVERVRRFFEPGGAGNKADHISVFALAPMPLLIALGAQLSNKVSSDLYQRHRDTEDWAWKKKGDRTRFRFHAVQAGTTPENVALIMSLSGTVPLNHLPPEINNSFSIYELTLDGSAPNTGFLKTRNDLEAFRAQYQIVLGTLEQNHPGLTRVHLFPAVPAPVAVLCGRELLPTIHPRLRVYDFQKASGVFTFRLDT